MAYRCALCGKMGQRGNLVSHSKRRSKKVFRPNLHTSHISVNGVMRKVRLCTTCLRTIKKNLKLTMQSQAPESPRVPRLPKVKEQKKVIEHAKIPQEVILEMKEKSKEKKVKSAGNADMDLVNEIMSESLQKEKKSKK